MCDSLPCLFSPLCLVLAELRQTDLITSEECIRLSYSSHVHVLEVQRGKSPEVLTKTAEIFKRHGFVEESNLLAGIQTQPLIHVPMVCCVIEPSCKFCLKASKIIVSMLGNSKWVPEPYCLPT